MSKVIHSEAIKIDEGLKVIVEYDNGITKEHTYRNDGNIIVTVYKNGKLISIKNETLGFETRFIRDKNDNLVSMIESTGLHILHTPDGRKIKYRTMTNSGNIESLIEL